MTQWVAIVIGHGRVLHEEEPGGVEPFLGHPVLEVLEGDRSLLGVRRERHPVELQPRRLVPADLEAPSPKPLGEGRFGLVAIPESPRHHVELAGRDQPLGRDEGPSGRQVPVGPHARGSSLEQRVQERAAHARPTRRWIHDELSGPSRVPGGVAHRIRPVGAGQDVGDVVPRGVQRQPEGLRDRLDAVGVGGAAGERPDTRGQRFLQPRRGFEADLVHEGTSASAASGTKR